MAHDINKDRIRKHKKLARHIIKRKGDKARAWQDIHPHCTDESASKSVSRYMIKHPQVTDYVHDLCEANDLPASFFLKKLNELSNAKKTIIYNNQLIEVEDNTNQSTMV